MLAQVAHGRAWDVPQRCSGERCRVPRARGGLAVESHCTQVWWTRGFRMLWFPPVRALPRQKSRKGLIHVYKTPAIPAGSKGNVLAQQDEAGPQVAAPQMQFGCHQQLTVTGLLAAPSSCFEKSCLGRRADKLGLKLHQFGLLKKRWWCAI